MIKTNQVGELHTWTIDTPKVQARLNRQANEAGGNAEDFVRANFGDLVPDLIDRQQFALILGKKYEVAHAQWLSDSRAGAHNDLRSRPGAGIVGLAFADAYQDLMPLMYLEGLDVHRQPTVLPIGIGHTALGSNILRVEVPDGCFKVVGTAMHLEYGDVPSELALPAEAIIRLVGGEGELWQNPAHANLEIISE